jgi:hypothetical protein
MFVTFQGTAKDLEPAVKIDSITHVLSSYPYAGPEYVPTAPRP